MATGTSFTAVVLAGDRKPDDPVARAASVGCKALAPVGGKPMVVRVLDALGDSAHVNSRILCGPPWSAVKQSPELQAGLAAERFTWMPHETTPSASALAVMRSLPETMPILVTTADHALLSTAMVDHFCAQAGALGGDVAVAVAPLDRVRAAYPEVQRTAIKLQDNAYSGCNLFAFMTPQARAAADFWRQVESQRKKPAQVIIGALGWWMVLRYLLGRLSLQGALDRVSRRMRLRVGAVVMPFAEAAIDVDTVADWRFVERIINNRATEA